MKNPKNRETSILKTVFSFHLFNKKKLLIFLALFCPFSLGKIDIEGSFLIRGSFLQAKSFLAYNQLHLNNKFHPSNDLKIQTHLLFPKFYGEHSTLLAPSFAIYPSTSWFINEDLQLKLGRNLYTNPFHQIVSLNPYEAFFYSFDGAFLEYNTQILNFNIWTAYLPKRWIGLKQEQEFKYGMGAFLDIKLTESYIDFFNLHVAYLGNSLIQSSDKKTSRYGVAVKGTIQPIQVNYTVIAIWHGSGFQFKIEEEMYHVALNYFRPDFFNSRFFIGAHSDSPKYESWLYDRHKNAGLSDIFSWGNLKYYFVGLSLSPFNKWDIQAIFHDFYATEAGGSIELGYFGALIHKNQESSLSDVQQKLGKELDIQIKTHISKEFQVQLTTGFFFSQIESKDFLKNQNFYNNIQLAGLYKF